MPAEGIVAKGDKKSLTDGRIEKAMKSLKLEDG